MHRPTTRQSTNDTTRTRGGFTLVELLVVMSILLILLAMTAATVNFTLDAERLGAAARQVQSALEGARDRAIYAGEPRGLRLLLNPDVTSGGFPFTVGSMVYIGAPELYSQGTIELRRPDSLAPTGVADSPDITVVHGTNTDWDTLYRRGVLATGARIRIPAGPSGSWYTVTTDGSNELGLTTPFRARVTPTEVNQVVAFAYASGPTTYELELPPAVLPNQEPILLPQGIVIDLPRSETPGVWGNATSGYTSRMDILFSPRGTVIGTPAASGVIHLALADVTDAENNLPLVAPNFSSGAAINQGDWVTPGNGYYYRATANAGSMTAPSSWPEKTGAVVTDGTPDFTAFKKSPNRLVTLFTLTGQISTHQVYPNASDPYRYAETGEASLQ